MRTHQQLPPRALATPDPAPVGTFAAPVQLAATAGISSPSGALPFAGRIQESFGAHDVSGVRAHSDGEAAATARAMGASAYASGNHVVFAETPTLRLAAHEAAHIVQQRAKIDLPDGVSRVGDPYERHADAVAERVVAGRSAADLLDPMAPTALMAPSRARLAAPDSGAARQVQMQINLGWVPTVPANWRKISTKTGKTAATDGFGKFGDKKGPLETNNIAQALAGHKNDAKLLRVQVPKKTYPISDASEDPLFTYDKAKQFAPETDHIVKRAHGGSNDYENARLLSKAENNDAAVTHAKPEAFGGPAGETSLRIYTPLKIDVAAAHVAWFASANPSNLATGDALNLDQARALSIWSGQADPVNWAGFTKAIHKAVRAKTADGTKTGHVTVT
jgi:hypothetical protein